MGIGRYSRSVFHRVISQTCAGIRLREVLEIYYSCRCHSLPRDLAGSSEALQLEDKSADRQDTWDEVICTQSDDDDNKRNGTLADILEDFDWRAELKLLEQENKQAEVNFYYKKHILCGSRSSAVAACTRYTITLHI